MRQVPCYLSFVSGLLFVVGLFTAPNAVADDMLLFLTSVNASRHSFSYVLPGTGQTACYDDTDMIACPGPGEAFHGQDANARRVPPTYQDNGDGTVRDKVTGLVWQQADDGTQRTWDDAMASCPSLDLGGHADWRLPSRRELLSIVDAGEVNPAIHPVFTAASGAYWASTLRASASTYGAWYVDFGYGNASTFGKTEQIHVRCVRGRPLADSSYADNGNATVTDTTTGLTWQKTIGPLRNWKEALSWCENATTAGYTDWRLPNKRELEVFVDDSRFNPAINPVFPDEGTVMSWTGTTDTQSPDDAWYVVAYDGASDVRAKYQSASVRCVRGGSRGRAID